MKGVLDMYGEIRNLGKVIASHCTADGVRLYLNVGKKQVVRVDVKLQAKEEVEALLRQCPFFAVRTNNS